MKRLHFHLTTDQTDLLLARGKSLFARLSDGTVQLWNSCWYFPLLLLVMLAALATGQPVLGVIVLGLLASWFLAFCPDLIAAITPFGMIFLLSTSEYENLGRFLPCVFLLIPLMTSLVLHLTTWPVELRLGTSARGLILVSAATILGGCGVISWEQYTNPLSLYYMLGLGVCMLGVYVLFRSQLREHRTYNLQVRFAQIFCALGWGMVLVVAVTYAKNWQEFIESGSALYLSYRNFAATILLTTLPMPFYLAGLKKYHLLSAPVFMAALLLTGSRTALVFGAMLLVLCCVYLVRTGVVSKWAMLGLTAAGAAALALFGMDAVKSLYEFRLSGSGHLISGDEDRWKLLAAGVQDFLRHPLFGTGLGNTAHSALAVIVPGSMAFYHNLVAQVIGSMGIVGIFAYGVLIRDRFSLLLRGRKDPFVGAMLLSYLAMLMVSMTNPGEFCPFPNAALMVMVFSMVEEAVGAETVTVTQLRRRGALRGSTGGSYAQYK